MKKRNKMKKKSIMLAAILLHSVAFGHLSFGAESTICMNASEERQLALDKKILPNKGNGDKPDKAPILVPMITMDGHTLHFITPCTGLTLQLVQDDEVCYETVITSDYLEIPSSITGVYELQILRGDYVFFAEVDL